MIFVPKFPSIKFLVVAATYVKNNAKLEFTWYNKSF